MPIFDFQCSSCGFKDELMRKSSDASTIACPQCKLEMFSKMLSAPSFQLSGSGWYATDFKDKKPPPATNKLAEDSTKTTTVEPPATKATTTNVEKTTP